MWIDHDGQCGWMNGWTLWKYGWIMWMGEWRNEDW